MPVLMGMFWEDGRVAASSLSVGNGVQASGRVDVPGGDLSVITCKLQLPADASAAVAKSTDLVGFFCQGPSMVLLYRFPREVKKQSWISHNVFQFAQVFRNTCSAWFSNQRFFLDPGLWRVLALRLIPTSTCAFGCVVVLVVAVFTLNWSGTAIMWHGWVLAHETPVLSMW